MLSLIAERGIELTQKKMDEGVRQFLALFGANPEKTKRKVLFLSFVIYVITSYFK